jgi:hypothetical protein
MAEIRNTFVKSKMNKDLDDRLLSKGEYRNAENVQISRSEGEDVGALENVLGNNLITNWSLNSVANLEIIGYTVDQTNDRAFFIATNYTDVSDNELDNPAPYGASCYILMFDNKAIDVADKYKILVEGRFLNFSKTHPVFGIDLIEDLLFWTDNRNQPRKINVTKAIADSTYYTTEDQISVAKYYPYSAPQLWTTKDFKIQTIGGSDTTGPHRVYQQNPDGSQATDLKVGMYFRPKGGVINPQTTTGIPLQVSRGPEGPIGATGPSQYYEFYTNYAVDFGGTASNTTLIYRNSINVTDEYLPPSSRGPSGATTSGTLLVLNTQSITGEVLTNMLVECPGKINNKITISSITINGSNTEITCSGSITTGVNSVASPDIVTFSWPNPNYISTWPGDKDFLLERFVRFAYRFKFDDGEYSLISPFTQPAFVPKQDGYIINRVDRDDQTALKSQEEDIRSSTIVSFFENSVDQVDVNINTPYIVNQLSNKLKVEEIQVLYKESDGLAIQVLDTIPVSDASIIGNNTNIYTYRYQSRKPFRTLPERETLRVFDKVPIRALSQSVSGNRVIYGNFIDKHTPPENLNYNVQASKKYTQAQNVASGVLNPYGGNSFISYPTHTLKQNRTYQVGIVLSDRYGRQSDVVLSSITNFQFSQGGSSNVFDGSTIFHPYKDSNPSTSSSKWFGDNLKVLFRDKIPETVNYADGYPGLYKSGEYTSVVDTNSTQKIISLSSIDPNVAVGDIVTGTDSGGAFVDSITVVNTSNNTITVNNNHTLSIDDVITISGPENKLGWYTYKIVVKQQAQEYYNTYLPTFLQGEPNSTGTGVDSNATQGYTTLLSDNINKIPSDLTEVQPEQTQFRTSDVILFPRVGPNLNINTNTQYFIDENFITVDSIAKVTDLAIGSAGPPIAAAGIYDAKSDPTVARLTLYDTNTGGTTASSSQQLSIFEVKPPQSRLEIYWETSTCGLISELNSLIDLGDNAQEELPEDDAVPE